MNLNFLDEIAEVLLTLLLKQFFQTVWSEVVEKLDNVILFVVGGTTDMEIDTNTKGNMHIIFSWNVINWALESNCVLRNKGSDSLVAAVHPVSSWLDETRISSAGLLEREHTIWNVELANAAPMVLVKKAHNWHALSMGC